MSKLTAFYKLIPFKESSISFEYEIVNHYLHEEYNYTIILENYKPVSRLAGSNYAKIGELFSVKRN